MFYTICRFCHENPPTLHRRPDRSHMSERRPRWRRLGIFGIIDTMLAIAIIAIVIKTISIELSGGAAPVVEVQVIGFNDFHGNLRPPTGRSGQVDGVDAGGAAYLATWLKKLREGQSHTITVAAGDNVGASPLISALF